jgi:hypothetical protein
LVYLLEAVVYRMGLHLGADVRHGGRSMTRLVIRAFLWGFGAALGRDVARDLAKALGL